MAPQDKLPLFRIRDEAHQLFDQLWKSGAMSRFEAYKWLARVMGLRIEDAHFRYFTAEQCYRAKRLISDTYDQAVLWSSRPPAHLTYEAKEGQDRFRQRRERKQRERLSRFRED